MPKSFISRGLPYYVPAIAFGNLLWLNVALAPVVFADQAQGGESERRARTQASASPFLEDELAPGSANSQRLQSPALEGERLTGRCDDSTSHETLAFIDFETNATEPTAASSDRLRSIVDDLEGEQPRIWVDGHADERGAADYNERLSLLRAQAITDHLVGLGMEPARIEVRSFGETTPLVSGPPALQWKNRQAVVCIEKASL